MNRERLFSKASDREYLYLLSLAGLAGVAIRATQESRKWKQLARFDHLTKLHNRAAYRDAFDQIQKHLINENEDPEHNLLLIDIDHFKRINDTHGHHAGDKVLKDFAENLQVQARVNDLVFRYGGEEFGILLYRTSHEDALDVAERIAESIRQKPNFGNVSPLTASIGVSSVNLYESAEYSINTADKALYVAKNAGRDQVVSFNRLPEGIK
jgi:diguanylate cyclase (GGDEF)-like protein